ncbi:L-rhamnose/proton symporter RhaT [Ereboglobus luteus]|uniref:Rhamnose/proton symporter RhaT n=1 Tax=Ereboglobus luteus TaxID=1796921 RepID=A0A2U8E1B2_9BACT|nr:L-rhamnose/proton symporter RhaT [Ereboglobus luteus]AWI08658.1 rhamnose/proton symporter RhaT [Ereboglobus luteus]
MHSNPILGVVFHWLGGLASGSFYVPYKGVKKWAWEVYWLVGGVFSWIVCPAFFAWLITKDHNAFGILREIWQNEGIAPFVWPYVFGMMWGCGGLTFGLTMRYLGMSLGMGVALGYCTVFGTLLPPLLKIFVDLGPAVPKSLVDIVQTRGGIVTMVGIAVTVLGIFIAAKAGLTKEREMPEAEKKKAIAEFDFKKGILVATFSGVMSAGMAFAITAGNPIAQAIEAGGTDKLWAGIPRLVVILLGGFTTNFIWCVYLNIKNKTGYQYLASHLRSGHANLAPQNLAQPAAGRAPSADALRIPRASNFFFSALAGATWYFQFFFYNMGESQMGEYGFASWTLHMASIIIFSTLWGVYFKEWSGVSAKARRLITAGIATLIISTVVIGLGTWLDT